jgi:maltose O-acetyltransferase
MVSNSFILKFIYAVFNVFPATNSKVNLSQKNMRSFIAKKLMLSCGSPVTIGKNIKIDWGNVSIGNNSGIGNFAKIEAANIGENVLMGEYCTIYRRNHNYKRRSKTIINQGYGADSIVFIGDDVWIGDRVIILPGISVGTGAVIGAGSIVTKNIQPYKVVAGCPAKEISERI